MTAIASRERIAEQAEAAAREFVRTGNKPECPYPVMDPCALAYHASFERALLPLTVGDDVERSA